MSQSTLGAAASAVPVAAAVPFTGAVAPPDPKRSVKLTSAEGRAWGINQRQWVSPSGVVLRAVTPEEEAAIFPAISAARKVGKSGRQTVTAQYLSNDASGARRVAHTQLDLVFKITRTGSEAEAFILDLYVGGNRYVQGREIIEKKILARHGECNLYRVGGQRIKSIRDPRLRRAGYSENRASPKPESCACRGWIDSQVGRHHRVCEWNRLAPANEKAIEHLNAPPVYQQDSAPVAGLAFAAVAAPAAPSLTEQANYAVPPPGYAPQQQLHNPQLEYSRQALVEPHRAPPPPPPAPEHQRGPTRAMVERAAATSQAAEKRKVLLQSPEQCENDCRGFVKGVDGWVWPRGRRPEDNQHHPLCSGAAAWTRHVSGARRMVVFDMDRQVAVRDATEEEVAEAEVTARRSGTPSIDISGERFAIVPFGQSEPSPTPVPDLTLDGTRLSALSHGAGEEFHTGPSQAEVIAAENARIAAEQAELALAQQEALSDSGLPQAMPAFDNPLAVAVAAGDAASSQMRDSRGLVGAQRGTAEIAPGHVPGLEQEPPEPVAPPPQAAAPVPQQAPPAQPQAAPPLPAPGAFEPNESQPPQQHPAGHTATSVRTMVLPPPPVAQAAAVSQPEPEPEPEPVAAQPPAVAPSPTEDSAPQPAVEG